MKKKYTIGTIILVLSIFVNMDKLKSQVIQSDFLFETKNNNSLTKEEFAEKYALKAKDIKDFHPINFDMHVLLHESKNPLINIDGNTLSLKKTKMTIKDQNSFSYFGIIDNNISNKAIINVRNGFAAGTFFLNSKEYNIITSKDMQYYLLRVDNNSNCGNNSEGTENIFPVIDKNTVPVLKSTNVNSCNMRILVLYTPNAEAYFSDILNSIEHVINVANEYLGNSLVDETYELAYAGLTNYTEYTVGDGRYTDINRFRIDGDGYMDEVHDLRDKYSADVCVLLSECQSTTGQCGGIAATIDANTPSWAFCLVHAETWGAVPNRLFSHEIGHLLGCRHDNDGTSSPYAYGHGYHYINSQTEFQTIMGTTWGIDYAPNFSNPDVYYNGLVTGTSNWNDCGRVCELEIPEKVGFLQPENNVSITSTDLSNVLYGDIISEQTVTIQNAAITDGSVLIIRSDETTISSNFTVELGAELVIKNEAVHGCN